MPDSVIFAIESLLEWNRHSGVTSSTVPSFQCAIALSSNFSEGELNISSLGSMTKRSSLWIESGISSTACNPGLQKVVLPTVFVVSEAHLRVRLRRLALSGSGFPLGS